jgi:hypothetical protein
VAATLWGPSAGGSVYTNGGLPFLAEQSELEECCCDNCDPCCENPWVFCFTVNDGGATPLYAYASISITTVLSACCCTIAAPGYVDATLKRSSDGVNIGTVRMYLIVTHDGCFAQFTVTSASFSTCSPSGCSSAWIDGTLTGTPPAACEITFEGTIARNGTTALNFAASSTPCP